MRLLADSASTGITQTFTYDRVHRPLSARVERGGASGVSSGSVATQGLNAVRVPFFETYDWDRASNLMRVTSNAGPDVFPSQYRQSRKTIEHDSLYRVAHVAFEYLQDDYTWGPSDASSDYRDERTNSHTDATGAVVARNNGDGSSHGAADPMRSRPAPMLPPLPTSRLADLTYTYDWMANETLWEDDARSFHERSIGQIGNGADHSTGRGNSPTLRPSALYIASNLPQSASEPLEPSNGWLDVDYGVSGNVVAMTVRAQCVGRGASACVDDPSMSPDAREASLLASCACANEQHFTYRWDELNRLAEARRYDRHDGGAWTLEARQRSRYDGGNGRVVKEVIDPHQTDAALRERTHLYVFAGDFERVGVRVHRNVTPLSYTGSAELGTETEYHVVGATLVHQHGGASPQPLDRKHRLTMPIRDLLGTASAVVDLESGHLVEMATYTPNGARETHWMTREASLAPERSGFTGKEEDEEVGVTYFGHRYLIARIGRWATPDPLSVHAMGGGEVANAFHYVAGSVLQARDPIGLNPAEDLFRYFVGEPPVAPPPLRLVPIRPPVVEPPITIVRPGPWLAPLVVAVVLFSVESDFTGRPPPPQPGEGPFDRRLHVDGDHPYGDTRPPPIPFVVAPITTTEPEAPQEATPVAPNLSTDPHGGRPNDRTRMSEGPPPAEANPPATEPDPEPSPPPAAPPEETSEADSATRPSTLAPGPYAGRSIPARGPGRDFTSSERAEGNLIGRDTGCHTCGSPDPGTRSGNHVLDHQPATRLAPPGAPQRLYPHCIRCSRRQGGEVNAERIRRAQEIEDAD